MRKPGTAVPGRRSHGRNESRRDVTYPNASFGSNAIPDFRSIASNSLS